MVKIVTTIIRGKDKTVVMDQAPQYLDDKMTSTSFPLGDINCTNLANNGMINTKTILPLILNILCAIAVLLAFFEWNAHGAAVGADRRISVCDK